MCVAFPASARASRRRGKKCDVCSHNLKANLYILVVSRMNDIHLDQEMVGGEHLRTGAKSGLKPPVRSPTEQEKKMVTALAMSLIVEIVHLRRR